MPATASPICLFLRPRMSLFWILDVGEGVEVEGEIDLDGGGGLLEGLSE